MPETNPQLEAELIAGFLSRRPAAENALIERLRPFLRQEIRHNFPSLWRSSADLQQSAFLKLCEARQDPREVGRIKPPLTELATYLINAPARVLRRSLNRSGQAVSLKEFDGRSRPNQQASTHLKELLELASTLPDEFSSVLLLQAAHATGDGPPLHEALGITKDAAKRKLLQAQDALLTLTRNEVDDD